jgi:hypothetical protein
MNIKIKKGQIMGKALDKFAGVSLKKLISAASNGSEYARQRAVAKSAGHTSGYFKHTNPKIAAAFRRFGAKSKKGVKGDIDELMGRQGFNNITSIPHESIMKITDKIEKRRGGFAIN